MKYVTECWGINTVYVSCGSQIVRYSTVLNEEHYKIIITVIYEECNHNARMTRLPYVFLIVSFPIQQQLDKRAFTPGVTISKNMHKFP